MAILSTEILLTESITRTRRDENKIESEQGFYAKLELYHIPSGRQTALPGDMEYGATGLLSQLVCKLV